MIQLVKPCEIYFLYLHEVYKGKDLYKNHFLYLPKVHKAKTYNKHMNN